MNKPRKRFLGTYQALANVCKATPFDIDLLDIKEGNYLDVSIAIQQSLLISALYFLLLQIYSFSFLKHLSRPFHLHHVLQRQIQAERRRILWKSQESRPKTLGAPPKRPPRRSNYSKPARFSVPVNCWPAAPATSACATSC